MMAAHLSVNTVGRNAAMGSGVLTTAYVTSTVTHLDARSIAGCLPIVARTASSMASLAKLPILNGPLISAPTFWTGLPDVET
ncbi:hypothetical protein R1flu_004219 [Riccia fluitans]|uniref:Uncharacterized protein n=1 Tax=Riccia fluitans TaxID=41844 RepID=A0ABD1YQH0_9MARC